MKPATASIADAADESDDATSPPIIGKLKALIESLVAAEWSRYPVTGLGTDLRLHSSRVIAVTPLVDIDQFLHTAEPKTGFRMNQGTDAHPTGD